MGGCATKPEVVKEQGGAPLPLEETAEVGVSESKVEGEKEDDGKRTSLGHLFRESEKRREAPENKDITVKETITTSQEETKGEEEEQTKAQVHPAPDSETTTQTVEHKEVSAPTHEETPVPSSVPTSEAHGEEEKPVEVENLKEIAENSSSVAVAVQQKAEVVQEKGDSELEASSTTEKTEDAVLPTSTTEREEAPALPSSTTETGEAPALPTSTTETGEAPALPSSTTEKEEDAQLPSSTTEEEDAAAMPSLTAETA